MPEKMKSCLYCKFAIGTRKEDLVCSNQSSEYNNQIVDDKCINCENWEHLEHLREKRCAGCDKIFIPDYRSEKYCKVCTKLSNYEKKHQQKKKVKSKTYTEADWSKVIRKCKELGMSYGKAYQQGLLKDL